MAAAAADKPLAFEEPISPLSSFRTMDLVLRLLSTLVCLAVLVLGGVSARHSSVFLIGILGPPATCVILWSLLQFALSNSPLEYINFRSRFRMAVGVLIAIGFAAADICLGIFRAWWADGSDRSGHGPVDDAAHEETPEERLVIGLTAAGLVLACLATFMQFAVCWITLRRLLLRRGDTV